MAIRQGAGGKTTDPRRRTSEHQLKSVCLEDGQLNTTSQCIENSNAMWRRPKQSSKGSYSTLPRKIHSTQPKNIIIGQSTVPSGNGGHMSLSHLQPPKNPRDGLYLPVSSLRSHQAPTPPLRGDSVGKKNADRRFSDITYAELSLKQHVQQNAHNNSNQAFQPNTQPLYVQRGDPSTTIASLSEGVPAELRVTSPTTLYATIGRNKHVLIANILYHQI